MAERQAPDEEERAWATAQARALLAPCQARGGRREATGESGAGSRAVLVVAVVPLPPQASGERREARGDDEQEQEEQEGDG